MSDAILDHDAVRTAYRRWATVYDTVFGAIWSPARHRSVDAVNRLPGARVLEVGVGTGLALPRYLPEKRIVGIDLSPEMLARAKERAADLPNVESLRELDAEATGLPTASFDISIAMFVASVVPHPRRLVAEMRRVVRPGGHLLFVSHFRAEAGPRLWAERSLSRFARKLGWHPDFAPHDMLTTDEVMAASFEALPPLGFFALVHVRN